MFTLLTRLFNKWLDLATKEKIDKNATAEALNIAIGQLLSHHVLTNPAELLTHTVKLSKKPASERNEIEQSSLEQLKEYLIDAYKKVNCIKLEFKLMNMAKKGQATKTRDFLTNHVKNSKHQSFFETGGMSIIRQALQDPSNNNATLLLFVEQTGLIDELLNSLYKEDYKLAKKTIRTIASQFIATIQTRVYLSALFNEFLTKQTDIINPSKDDLLKSMDSYLETLLESKSDKKLGKYIDKYWNDFRDVIKSIEIPQNSSIKEVLATVHESCISNFDNELLYCQQQMNNVLSGLYADINLLNSIKVIDTKEEAQRRDAHLEKIEKVMEYIQNCAAFLSRVKSSEYTLE